VSYIVAKTVGEKMVLGGDSQSQETQNPPPLRKGRVPVGEGGLQATAQRTAYSGRMYKWTIQQV
jgi:hypothetical protein